MKMKKECLLLLMLIFPFLVVAQEKQSVVTLKNGTELTGVIKAIDPMDAMTIVIGSVETTIKMADVASVKDAVGPITSISSNEDEVTQLSTEEKLVVTDFAEYPESFDLKIGNTSIKMILVRGGNMNMGYNGRHSISMDSEPVHKVGVSSFYMSETHVTNQIVAQVKGKKGNKKGYSFAYDWDVANNMTEKIAETSGVKVRLPTEAEWEYAACSSVQDQLFDKCDEFEYCSDWYAPFSNEETLDPQGPTDGKNHVTRAYKRNHGKLNRSPMKGSYDVFCGFRLVIKAKDVK